MAFFSDFVSSTGIGRAATSSQTAPRQIATPGIAAASSGSSFFDSVGGLLSGVASNVANTQLERINDRAGGGRELPGVAQVAGVGGVGAALGLALVAMLGVVLVVKLVR